jgi:hypothetical protein
MVRLQQNGTSIPIACTDYATDSPDSAAGLDAIAASIHTAIISTGNTTSTTQLLSA